MFTGIVQGTSAVTSVSQKPSLTVFVVDLGSRLSKGLNIGASVSVDGVCFTATQIDNTLATFEAIQETLDRSTFATIAPGRLVNIERSASATDEVGGHRVSGHITGMVNIQNVHNQENERILTLNAPDEWINYVFPKGFITLDGASLTVVDVNRQDSVFTVHLIPETLRATTFANKQEGDRLNFEIDAQTQTIVDTVERIMSERAASTPAE